MLNITDIYSGNPYKKTFNSINETRLSSLYEHGTHGMMFFNEDRTDDTTITICQDCVINLKGHTLTNIRFVIDGNSMVVIKNGCMKNDKRKNLISVKCGKCELKDLYVTGYALTGSEDTRGLVSLGYTYTEEFIRSMSKAQLASLAQSLTIGEGTLIEAKGSNSGCIAEKSIFATSYSDLQNYISRPTIDIYGKITCEGPIAIWEWGSDTIGTDINVYEGSVISCSYETAISKINGGTLNLYGGKISGQTGICMRYMNSLNVPTGSTVEVAGFGTKNSYVTTGSSWDNDEHLWQTGHALAIDRNYRTQKLPGVISINGGTWKSVNNLAIGSYPYMLTNERLLRFVSNQAEINDGIPSTGLPYDVETGENSDYQIYVTDPEPETGPYRFYSKSNQFMSGLKTFDMTKLPKIGDTIVFKEWTEGDNYYDIVGYDVNVPEYVGYMNENNEVVYVRVWDDTTNNTRSVAVGDKTYSRSFVTGGTYSTFTDTNKTVSEINGNFSYGNLNPFSVPSTITVGGKVYSFCGHTATVLSKKIRTTSKFGSDNVWKASTIRSLVSENFGWEREEVLLKNMMKSCNITWGKNETDGNGNTLDQFFIPSNVELGHTHTYLKDKAHSKFKKSDTEYLDDDSRKKGKGNHWWTRSQSTSISDYVWYVTEDGGIKDYGHVSAQSGVVPAFVIG